MPGVRVCWILASVGLAPLGAGDAPLASQVFPAVKAEVKAKGEFGEFRAFLTGETRGLEDLLTGVAVIEPGQQIHPPHDHAEEEFLLVAKGEGTWHLDGRESPAREGDLLYVAPWVVHGLRNTSGAPLTFFVVKWNGAGLPRPEKPAGGGPAGGAAPPGSIRGAIASAIRSRADVKPDAAKSPPVGDVRRYWNGAATRSLRDLVTGVATLLPGQEVHPPHQHAEEELLYVVEGRGTWHLEGRDLPASPGDLLYTRPWAMHGLRNSGPDPLTFHVLKWNAAALPIPERPSEE